MRLIEGASGYGKQKPIKTDTAINRIKTSETNKLSIENTSGRKWNKNRWDLQTANTTRKTNTAVNTKQTCTQKGICSLR